MSIHRRSPEIARLIDDLSSGDALQRETALARLTLLGTRAVDRLIALAGDTSSAATTRVAALQALEAIGDPRAANVATSLIDSDDHALAIAAIGVLGPLSRQRDVRGTRALERLTALALASEQSTNRRLAALSALDGLPERLIAPVYDALTRDPAPLIAARATRKQRDASLPLEDWVARGLPDNPVALAAIVREDADNARLADLRQLIELLRSRERSVSADQRHAWMTVRGLVHQSLATRRSRIAQYDLRETLEQAAGPLPVGFLAALTAIGDSSFLEPIAGAWMRASAPEQWWRDHLADAFAAIVKRERVTRRHAVVKRILERWPAADVLVGKVRKEED